jgi:D-tyrosyl-tRNA(Tyr) deacylase
MRILAQRVAEASVTVAGERIAEIGPGLLLLVGVTHGDDADAARYLAGKVANLRIFHDDEGKMNLSVLECGHAVLVVSQFTLYGDARKGRRPSFVHAAPPEIAEPLVEVLTAELRALGLAVQTGRFGAEMAVGLVNDGPVTLWLDTAELRALQVGCGGLS